MYRGSNESAEKALCDLVEMGFGTWKDSERDSRGGRPTRIFQTFTGGNGNGTPEDADDWGTSINAAEPLTELAARGVSLQADGAPLRSSPRNAPTLENLEGLRKHKPEILPLLAGDGDDPTAGSAHRSDTELAANAPDPQDRSGDDEHGGGSEESSDDNYEFEERAAIHEFEAGLPRHEAERLARLETRPR